jgi:hypothetical protein
MGLGLEFRVCPVQIGQTVPTLVKRVAAGLYVVADGTLKFAGVCLSIKKDVQNPAKNGKQHDQKNPGNFICRFGMLIQNMYADYDAEEFENPTDIVKIDSDSGNQKPKERNLYQKGRDYKNPSAEYNPA